MHKKIFALGVVMLSGMAVMAQGITPIPKIAVSPGPDSSVSIAGKYAGSNSFPVGNSQVAAFLFLQGETFFMNDVKARHDFHLYPGSYAFPPDYVYPITWPSKFPLHKTQPLLY
jgi:hypothetical protein